MNCELKQYGAVKQMEEANDLREIELQAREDEVRCEGGVGRCKGGVGRCEGGVGRCEGDTAHYLRANRSSSPH